jgi:hypothetical protein
MISIRNKYLPKIYSNFNNKNFGTIEKIFTTNKLEEYRDKGFTILPKVFSKSLIDDLKGEVDNILNQVNIEEINSMFDPQHLKSDKYFMESGDKVKKLMN